MITITNLSKSFQLSRQQKKEMGNAQHGDTVHAVKNISLTCQPGRVFTLLGPNGAGKTTTLRMIAKWVTKPFWRITPLWVVMCIWRTGLS